MIIRLRGCHREHEVDLIVEGPYGQLLAIEVKLAAEITDHDVQHLLWLRDALPDRQVSCLVINTGRAPYQRPDGVNVVPYACLGV